MKVRLWLTSTQKPNLIKPGVFITLKVGVWVPKHQYLDTPFLHKNEGRKTGIGFGFVRTQERLNTPFPVVGDSRGNS